MIYSITLTAVADVIGFLPLSAKPSFIVMKARPGAKRNFQSSDG